MKTQIFVLAILAVSVVLSDHFEQTEEIVVSGDLLHEYAANMGIIDKVLYVLKEFEEQTGKTNLPDEINIHVINKDAGDKIEYFCLRHFGLVKGEC